MKESKRGTSPISKKQKMEKKPAKKNLRNGRIITSVETYCRRKNFFVPQRRVREEGSPHPAVKEEKEGKIDVLRRKGRQ